MNVERMPAMQPRITLDRVNVHLSGRHVLKNISWSLDAGEHWAFVGANGSGKSTLLRVLAGTQWIDYDGGTRSYSPNGVRIDAVGRAATWIRHVSAEQHERYARLDLPLSGRAIIESGYDNSVYVHRQLESGPSQHVDALIDRLDLAGFAARPLRELSSGQIRRLLIARAFVREPQVLILDEFTNGLDRAARSDVFDLLDAIARSVTLVVASHRAADFPSAIRRTATVHDGHLSLVSSSQSKPRQPVLRNPLPLAIAQREGAELLNFRAADVYRGQTLVLRNVTWQLRRGEHTAIRGSNGAGKTTFAGLIAGTIPAATGAHIVRFGATGPFDIWELKRRIAHVSDDLQIAYDWAQTVEEVIASGFAASIGLFMSTTAQQNALVSELIGRFALEPLAKRTFTQLSFGERRKVLIARSLVRRPDIFILDEIWNGLDSEFRAAFRAELGAMARGGTTLVTIAHDDGDGLPQIIRICTIENGTIRDQRLERRGTGEAQSP